MLHPEFAFYNALCVPIMLGLTIWQLSSLQIVSSLLNEFFPNDLREKWGRLLVLIMHLGAVGIFIAPCYLFFPSISDLLSNNAVNMNWGFGQIVAILATVPTVFRFVHAYIENKRSSHVKKIAPRFLVDEPQGQSYEQLALNDRGTGA